MTEMKNKNINTIIRDFFINEGSVPSPTIKSRLMALEELISKISGKSLTEHRRLEIVKEQLKEVKRDIRKLEEKNFLLEEENKDLKNKITLLEENKEE